MLNKTLIFATQNQNKVKEIKQLCEQSALSYHIQSLKDINFATDAPEYARTIADNALQKALFIYKQTGRNCFAEDSGLEIEALNGAPGVYSARYAGRAKNDEANIKKALDNLKNISNRSAQFKTIIALIINQKTYLFQGIIKGKITLTPQGNKGFGYDPIFMPENHNQTFAQMTMAEKNAISHRQQAFKQMVNFLKNL